MGIYFCQNKNNFLLFKVTIKSFGLTMKKSFTKFWIRQHCLKSKQRISGFNMNLPTQLFLREQMKWAFYLITVFVTM